MTFRDGQARGPRIMQCLPLLRSLPLFLGCARLVLTACSDRSVTRTAGARGHRRDGARSRSARRRRLDGAPLRQLPRRAGPGPRSRPRSTHGAISSRTSRCTCSPASRVSNSRQRTRRGSSCRSGWPGAAARPAQGGPLGRPARLRSGPGARGRRVEGQLRGLGRALTQVSTSVICDRSSGLYSTGRRRSAPLQRASAARSRAAESC